mmetsp:Transcript_17855/g.32269  ORF Transcript_17855/g.32269 Transcript_17855/m.32269 type:complete len:100 (+) Transcript_17855:273-572(+)
MKQMQGVVDRHRYLLERDYLVEPQVQLQHTELDKYTMLASETYVSARFFDLLFDGGKLTEEGDIVLISLMLCRDNDGERCRQMLRRRRPFPLSSSSFAS